MIDPRGLIAAFRSVVVSGKGAVVDGNGSPDDFRISLGTGRANLASGGVFSREFFGMLTIDEGRLFVPEEGVGTQTRGVVAFSGIGAEAGTVEVNPAIEFDQDVLGGTIRPGEDGKGLASLNNGNGGLVGVRDRAGSSRIAAVGQSIGIEGCITIASVLAGYGDPRNFRSILIKRDGCAGP